MAATTSSGLRLGRSNTLWKAYQIYFPTDPESPPYLLGVNRNRRFPTESFSACGAASPCFGPMGRVSSRVQFGRVLGLDSTLAPLRSTSHLFIFISRRQERWVLVRCKFSFCYFLVNACADPAARLLVFRTPPY